MFYPQTSRENWCNQHILPEYPIPIFFFFSAYSFLVSSMNLPSPSANNGQSRSVAFILLQENLVSLTLL